MFLFGCAFRKCILLRGLPNTVLQHLVNEVKQQRKVDRQRIVVQRSDPLDLRPEGVVVGTRHDDDDDAVATLRLLLLLMMILSR